MTRPARALRPARDAASHASDLAWTYGGMFALALLVRALYLLSIRHAFFFDHLQTEPARYDAWARAIVAGVAPARPPFDEGPTYAYFVALVYRATGGKIFAVTAIQAVLDSISCAAVTAASVRIFGLRAGVIAGVVAALFAPTIYFVGQLEPATLAVFAVTAALAVTPVEREANGRRWMLAGLAWAFALTVRSEIAIAIPFVMAHAFRLGRRPALARVAIAPAALLSLSLAVNAISSGHAVVLTTGSGVNAWIGNHPNADGVSPFLQGESEAVARDVESKTHDAVVADALFRSHALAFVGRQPGDAIALAFRKLMWVWTDRELPNAADIDWQTSQSWLFVRPVFPLRFGVVLPFALAGAFALGRRWKELLVLAAPAAIAVGVSVVFFTNARFRLVMSPTLAILAGFAIDRAVRTLASAPEEKRRAFAALGAGFVLGVALAYNDFGGVRELRLPEIDENTALLEQASRRSSFSGK